MSKEQKYMEIIDYWKKKIKKRVGYGYLEFCNKENRKKARKFR
jgi:hypothetical protein